VIQNKANLGTSDAIGIGFGHALARDWMFLDDDSAPKHWRGYLNSTPVWASGLQEETLSRTWPWSHQVTGRTTVAGSHDTDALLLPYRGTTLLPMPYHNPVGMLAPFGRSAPDRPPHCCASMEPRFVRACAASGTE
jgi:hypothetical protein